MNPYEVIARTSTVKLRIKTFGLPYAAIEHNGNTFRFEGIPPGTTEIVVSIPE